VRRGVTTNHTFRNKSAGLAPPLPAFREAGRRR
jgi:hypothetical protein